MSPLRIVLVGKTGAGKSSAGNTILGREAFKAAFSLKPVTAACQKADGDMSGRRVTVVDTPGLFDINVPEEEIKNKVAECFSMCHSGPHAFLLVMKLGRFTPEEKKAAEEIQEVFGQGVLRHTMVLFTGGDQLNNPNDIHNLIQDCEELTYILDKVGGRYHVFSNRMNDHDQVEQLLKKIDEMVENSGMYLSDLFQKAEDARKEEAKRKDIQREKEVLRQEWDEKPELRLLLIGKNGRINTTASNIILQSPSASPYLQHCEKRSGEVLGRKVSVVNTPGLSDGKCDIKQTTQEIASCICMTSPGPHAFVIVTEPGKSTEVKSTLKMITDVFGKKAKNYAIELTLERGKEHYHRDDESELYNSGHSSDQDNLLEPDPSPEACENEGVCPHTFYLGNMQNYRQATMLLQKIDAKLLTNGRSFFSNDLYPRAERAIRAAQKEILEKRKVEIQKEKRVPRRLPDGADFESSSEWIKEMVKARKEAEKKNRFLKVTVAFASSAIGGLGGAGFGALCGVIGGAAGGPVGIAVGAAIGAGVAGGVGALSGGAIGGLYANEFADKCKKVAESESCKVQ